MKRQTKAAALAGMVLTGPVWAQDGGITTLPLNDPFADILNEELQRQEEAEASARSDDVAANLVDAPIARLRGLDTLTNTVNDFEIRVGQSLRFKRLVVTLDACKYPKGNLRAEAYAHLRIRDEREDEDRFAGWMIATSPAFSALDHPRYDIWVLNCNTD